MTVVCSVEIKLGNSMLRFVTQKNWCISRISSGNGKHFGHLSHIPVRSVLQVLTIQCTLLIVCLDIGINLKIYKHIDVTCNQCFYFIFQQAFQIRLTTSTMSLLNEVKQQQIGRRCV